MVTDGVQVMREEVMRRSWLLLVSLSGLYSTIGPGKLAYRVAHQVVPCGIGNTPSMQMPHLESTLLVLIRREVP